MNATNYKNHKYIGAIMSAGLYDEFIRKAKALSLDMGGNEFEKRVTSYHPIIKASQEAQAACEVFKIARIYYCSAIGTWQHKAVGKFGIF